jgi:DNA polymerase-3 subunit gamma/tau
MALSVPLSVKYRPKKLSEVIGQPVIVKAFANAYKTKTLHHAYILSGNYGCGKTTVARIVAAMDNCDKNSTGKDPCGECDNCREIFTGKSLEVKEIDAASTGGADNIRDLNKELYQTPIKCRVKYVIIDEAHSLTRQAAEASLKMIEEPPKFVRFILCTTEPQSFKPTIHSRCILWSFNKVGWTEIYNHLKVIAQKEEIKIDEAALQLTAKYAKGSVRNSLQNLQTLVNYMGGDSITKQDAIEALGIINVKLYFDFVKGVLDCNAMQCFQVVNTLFRDGKEARIIVDGMYEHLNNLLLARTCKNDLSAFDFSDDEIKRYCYQSGQTTGDMILRMMTLLNDVVFGIEYSMDPDKLFNKFAIESILSQKKEKSKR